MFTSRCAVLLAELRQRGIRLWIEGGQIHYASPPGALTPGLQARVNTLRDEILNRLQRSSEIAPRAPEVSGAESIWRPAEVQLSMANAERCPNVAAAALWDGVVQLDVFRASLDHLLQRHSILRTRYLKDEMGVTWAVTERTVEVPVRLEDFRSSGENSRQREALMFANSMIAEPFNVTIAPLMRAAILILSDSTTGFLFVVHHSLFDAASRNILLSEFLAVYRARLSGEPSLLAKAPMQYSMFAHEQRARMTGSRGLGTFQYWQKVFAGPEPLFWLPYERQTRVAEGLKVSGKLPTPVLDRLRRIASQQSVPLFIVVAAAFSILLSQWSSRSTVAFLILDSGRRNAEHVDLVGCTVNFWPLCVSLTGEPTFVEAMRRVHSSYVEALPHAHITFEKLGPRWNGAEEDRCCPIIFLNFTPYDHMYGELGTNRIESEYSVGDAEHLTPGSPVAFDLEVIESAEHLFWYVRYRTDLFDRTTIQHASDCLAQVFLRVTQDLHVRLSELTPNIIRREHSELPPQ